MSVTVNDFCACSKDCDQEFFFGQLDGEQDCPGSIEESQVCGVILLPNGVPPPTDWTDSTEWGSLIDNSNTTNTKGKYLAVIGGVAVPNKTEVTVARRMKFISMRTYTLAAQVFNLSHLQREFVRSFQCNPTNYRFWIETISGALFGGPNGIAPNFSDGDLPLGAGEGDFEIGNLNLEWKAKCDPDRAYVPNLGSIVTTAVQPSNLMAYDSTNVVGFDGTNLIGFS